MASIMAHEAEETATDPILTLGTTQAVPKTPTNARGNGDPPRARLETAPITRRWRAATGLSR